MNLSQSAESSHASGSSQGLKNLAAMHELLTRQGFCLPQFNSKFVNRVTLTKIYNGQIFGLKSQHLVFRQCATPPTKLVMVQKLEKYLAAMNIKSGIDMSKANFPDKPWLILAVATLSKG